MKINKFVVILFPLSFVSYAASFPQGIYGGIEGGYDWGRKIDFQPQQGACVNTFAQACWDNADQSFAASLGHSGVFGGRLGYRVNHFISTDLSYDIRNGFSWDQTFAGEATGFPFPRHRFIDDIQNQTLMANLYITPNLQWARLDPYLNAGLGAASNKTGNLSSVNLANGMSAQVSGDRMTSLAWQLGMGANYSITKHFFFDVGYRFLNLGKFQTGTTVLIPAMPSIARLQANHAYVHEAIAGINFMV